MDALYTQVLLLAATLAFFSLARVGRSSFERTAGIFGLSLSTAALVAASVVPQYPGVRVADVTTESSAVPTAARIRQAVEAHQYAPVSAGAVLAFEASMGVKYLGRCSRWLGVLDQAARRHDLPTAALVALAWRESGCRQTSTDGKLVISSAGAVCLLQVMPEERGFPGRPTADELASVETCAEWGARLLSAYWRDQGNLRDAFARYNGRGPTAERFADEVMSFLGHIITAQERRDRSSALATFPKWPQCPLKLTKAFGVPASYQPGGRHTGIDVAQGEGAPIRAVADGVVVHVGPLHCNARRACRGPSAVVIEHEPGLYTTYSHNRRALVRPGDVVRAGQVIAEEGNEGYSFGSHLHFEVVQGHWSGNWERPFAGHTYLDPLFYLGAEGCP